MAFESSAFGSKEKKTSLAVLMTTFNRREQTMRCLGNLFAQTAVADLALTVLLLDDASPDGTADAVREQFPQVRVLGGNGQLFWNRGMRVAFGQALQEGFDWYLLLNDDTELFPDALEGLLAAGRRTQEAGSAAVIAGATCDAQTGRTSYGGQRWKAGWRRGLELVTPHARELVACDTMNGNCTLVPRPIAEAVGNLDARFSHSFGDFDYGFRAIRAGFRVLLAPGFVGTCSDNARGGTWRDRDASFAQRWKHLRSVKGSPFFEWAVYCQRHLGMLWPIYAVSPYVKVLLSSVSGSGDARRSV